MRLSNLPVLALLSACATSPADSPEAPRTSEPFVGAIEQGDSERCERGASLFEPGTLHTIAFTLSEDNWAAMIREADESLEYGGPDKTYFDAQITLDGVALSSPVALRLKGHSSLIEARETGNAYPFKLDIDRNDDDLRIDGLKKLNLHPHLRGRTAANEWMSYESIRDFGIPTARLAPATVTVNGTSLGLYNVVEHISGSFVRCHYPAPYGDLYKPEEPVGNLAWRGPSIEDYGPEMEHKWPDETTHASLLTLLQTIDQQPAERFDDVLDVESVLAYLAVNVAVGNYDYYASFGHNYYLYESTPGRFAMIPWDMNFSQTPEDSVCGLGRNTEEWPVSHKLLDHEPSLQRYSQLMQEFLQGPGSIAAMTARLEAVEGLYGEFLDEDTSDEIRDDLAYRVQELLDALGEGVDECPEWED